MECIATPPLPINKCPLASSFCQRSSLIAKHMSTTITTEPVVPKACCSYWLYQKRETEILHCRFQAANNDSSTWLTCNHKKIPDVRTKTAAKRGTQQGEILRWKIWSYLFFYFDQNAPPGGQYWKSNQLLISLKHSMLACKNEESTSWISELCLSG